MMQGKAYLLVVVVLMGMSSCLKRTEYPPEPQIEFREFNINGDNTAELVIGFVDGDGDIGLDQEDTTGAFCYDTCLYHWNLFLEYYELQNGHWVHYPIDWTDPNAIPFYYRVPDVTPTGQNPALVGEIAVDLVAYFLDISEFDTARFEVTLVDRSLNVSNTVRTRSFLKP